VRHADRRGVVPQLCSAAAAAGERVEDARGARVAAAAAALGGFVVALVAGGEPRERRGVVRGLTAADLESRERERWRGV